MSLGLFHFHARKRGKKMIPHPAPSRSLRALDGLMYVVAFIAPLSSVPQVYGIYSSKHVDGLVLSSWILMTAINILWFVYGLAHRALPVWINSAVWFFLNGAVAVGIVLYS